MILISVAFLYPLKASENLRGHSNGFHMINQSCEILLCYCYILTEASTSVTFLAALKHIKLFRKLQNLNDIFNNAY